MEAEAAFIGVPQGWRPIKCPVKPGTSHDPFLTGDQRETALQTGGTLTEVIHECRKCGARCRWVKLLSDVVPRAQSKKGDTT